MRRRSETEIVRRQMELEARARREGPEDALEDVLEAFERGFDSGRASARAHGARCSPLRRELLRDSYANGFALGRIMASATPLFWFVVQLSP